MLMADTVMDADEPRFQIGDVALGGEAAARDAGKLRQEGRNYPVADGDVIHFRFNV